MSRPRCFNRSPMPEGEWKRQARVKRIDHGCCTNPNSGLAHVKAGHWLIPTERGPRWVSDKPIYRWRPSPFSPGCMAYAAPSIEDSVPWRERWQCLGCRWLPEAAVYQATLVDAAAKHDERATEALVRLGLHGHGAEN